MGSMFALHKKEKKFGEPGYSVVPDFAQESYIPVDTAPAYQDMAPATLSDPEMPVRQVSPDEIYQPDRQQATLPYVSNAPAQVALSDYRNSAGSAKVPTPPKPPGLKQILKESLISRIPIYGPAYYKAKQLQRQSEAMEFAKQFEEYKQEADDERKMIHDGAMETMKQNVDIEKMNSKVSTMVRMGVHPQEAMVRAGMFNAGKADRIRVMLQGSDKPVPALAYPDGSIGYRGPDGRTILGRPGEDPNILQTLPEMSANEMAARVDPLQMKINTINQYRQSLGQPPLSNDEINIMSGIAPKPLAEGREQSAIIRTMDEDGNEIIKIVPKSIGSTYKAPPRPEPTAIVHTVDPNTGKDVIQIVPKKAGTQFAEQDDSKVKEEARVRSGPAIKQVMEMSMRLINQKSSAEQKAKSLGMEVDAYLASNPEYRTYVDARNTVAALLAQTINGKRLSDQDVKIAAMMIPDPFKDNEASTKLKWQLLAKMYGLEEALGFSGGGQSGQSAPVVGGMFNGKKITKVTRIQ